MILSPLFLFYKLKVHWEDWKSDTHHSTKDIKYFELKQYNVYFTSYTHSECINSVYKMYPITGQVAFRVSLHKSI